MRCVAEAEGEAIGCDKRCLTVVGDGGRGREPEVLLAAWRTGVKVEEEKGGGWGGIEDQHDKKK